MRALFVRPSKKTDRNPVPHLGLALLSAMLKEKGHDVCVYDQLLFLGERTRPRLAEVIEEFKPDVIGFSIYTATYYESFEDIEICRKYHKPIMIGGPHPTIFHEEMRHIPGVDDIVVGEAEEVILDIMEAAKTRRSPEVIIGRKADVGRLVTPDFTSFLGWKRIVQYPLSTSRGCPYNCSFCSVKQVSSKEWRSRGIESCIEEIETAQERYPNLKSIKIVDDCPTYDMDRFKRFLGAYIERGITLEMTIDNVRADKVDREFVRLAREARNQLICIGAEHGNEIVFNAIGKGERIEDIRNAAGLIKQEGLKLGLCFVIGLPHDSLARTWDSIKLANELKGDLIFWNMAHPMDNTRIMEWYRENGAVLRDSRGYSSYEYDTIRARRPVVETRDFTMDERLKAHFIAVIETGQSGTNISEIFWTILYSFKYRYHRGITVGIPHELRALGKRALAFIRKDNRG